MAKDSKTPSTPAPTGSLTSRALTVVFATFILNIVSSVVSPKLWSILLPSVNDLASNNGTITPVKLYGSSMSTCTRRVATVLREKDVPYELVPIDFAKLEHKSPEYIATKQPFGQVPVLQDGDFILYESRVISRYIAAKYASRGTPGLIPHSSNLQAWAKFEEAASVEQNNFDPFASGIASEKVFKPRSGGKTDEKRVKELIETLQMKMEGYERILSKQKYLAGNEITLADLYHLPYGTMIMEQLGIHALTSKPNVARWWKDISSRPSWNAVKNGA